MSEDTGPFATRALPDQPDVTAPDGSDVRILAALPAGTMAHFTLAAGAVSVAARHRSVSELWFVLAGFGQMWRRHGDQEALARLAPGVSLSIPVGTTFQFRAGDDGPLTVVAVTMPPWPGEDEAELTGGRWPPTVTPGLP